MKKILTVPVAGRLIVNDALTHLETCLAGMGIAQVFELGIESLLKSGKLINLFPDWSDEVFPLYVYHTSRHFVPAKVRAFLDFLGASFLTPLDQPYPMIATGDIGELAAQILQEAWTGNRCIELEGPARYSQLNVAKTFSRLLNRTVTAKPVPRAEWAALFETQGTQADRSAPRIEMLEGFNSGWIAFEGTGTEHFRSRRTLEEVFQDLLRQEA